MLTKVDRAVAKVRKTREEKLFLQWWTASNRMGFDPKTDSPFDIARKAFVAGVRAQVKLFEQLRIS